MKDWSVTGNITENTKLILLYLTVLLAHICLKCRNLSHWEKDCVSLMYSENGEKINYFDPQNVQTDSHFPGYILLY